MTQYTTYIGCSSCIIGVIGTRNILSSESNVSVPLATS